MSSTSQTMITSSIPSIREGTAGKDTGSMRAASSRIDTASKDESVLRITSTGYSTTNNASCQRSHGLESTTNTSGPRPHTPITPTKHKYPSPPLNHLPPTPDPTPTPGTKRTYDATVSATAPSTPSKQPRLLSHTRSHRVRPRTTEKFSKSKASSAEPSISSVELKRAAESVLKQVEWELVEEEVAANRRGNVYRRILRNLLQEKIDDLVEKEEAGCGGI